MGEYRNEPISENQQSVECAGGTIHILVNPLIGVPPEIRAPLNTSDSLFGSGWGKIEGLFGNGINMPSDFWGNPDTVGTTSTVVGFKYPIYRYSNARFNVGKFIDVKSKSSGSWSIEEHKTELFRTWYTYSMSPNTWDLNSSVGVECGDKVSIQIGSKGSTSKLAWNQVLEIK